MAKKKADDIWDTPVDFNEADDWSDEDDFDFALDSDSDSGKKKKRRWKKKSKPLSVGRIIWMCIVALGFSIGVGYIGYVVYTDYITYPQREVVEYEKTGIYCLEQWEEQIKNLEVEFDKSYLNEEKLYSNGDDNKVAFYKKMLSTVKYHPLQVNAKNVFGNDYIDRSTDSTVSVDSYVEQGETVNMEVIDYDAIQFSMYKFEISQLMNEYELNFGDVNYENRLVHVFVDFMNWLPEDEIPTKIISRVPNMDRVVTDLGLPVGTVDYEYVMTEDEDIYLDKLLFSSYQFYDCLDRFSVIAAGRSLTSSLEYSEWGKLSSEEKENVKRPDEFNYKECCAKLWCGTYYLQNEHTVVDSMGNTYVSEVRAEVGDGTIGNPLGLYTDMVTSLFISQYDELGNISSYEEYPIRVELIEYGYSKDAMDYFESKDIRNRGITLASDVQYCYMIFNVTNLSNQVLTIDENMGLCDENGNVQARTGTIYGLQGSVTLQPDETGRIETWQSSTSLWKKYVIWGNDFARRAKLVYFRLLAGDIENTDEYKGVTVNTTRYGEAETSEESELVEVNENENTSPE